MMKLGHLTPHTLHRYRRSYELHLSTTFGLMPFTDVGPLDIDDWMVEQRDLPSTGKSIRNRHGWRGRCRTSRAPARISTCGRIVGRSRGICETARQLCMWPLGSEWSPWSSCGASSR